MSSPPENRSGSPQLLPLGNIVEESSRPTTSHEPVDNVSSPPQVSPVVAHRTYKRRGSTASHVDVGFFDPEGVQALERTISRMTSNHGDADTQDAASYKKFEEKSSSDSSVTLGESRFDFEKTLREVAQRWVSLIFYTRPSSLILSSKA